MLFFLQSFPLFLNVELFCIIFTFLILIKFCLLKQLSIRLFHSSWIPLSYALTHTTTRLDGITVFLTRMSTWSSHTLVSFLGLTVLHYKSSSRILNLCYCTLSKGKTIHNRLNVDEYICNNYILFISFYVFSFFGLRIH